MCMQAGKCRTLSYPSSRLREELMAAAANFVRIPSPVIRRERLELLSPKVSETTSTHGS